jgi:hypothetical protein
MVKIKTNLFPLRRQSWNNHKPCNKKIANKKPWQKLGRKEIENFQMILNHKPLLN